MDSERYTITPYDRDEDGYPCPPPVEVAVLRCDSCGETAERLTVVPEYDNERHCDVCMEETVRALAAEERLQMLEAAGLSKVEMRAYTSVYKITESEVA